MMIWGDDFTEIIKNKNRGELMFKQAIEENDVLKFRLAYFYLKDYCSILEKELEVRDE